MKLDLPRLPFDRDNVTDIAPMYRTLQTEQPITKVRTPAGDVAWLVTRYDQVKALLADERLGRSHPDPERAARISGSAVLGAPMGDYKTEKADHARMRRLLTPAFSAKRMRALRPRVRALADELLTALAVTAPPADLHEKLSFPLPVLVICELLGVPYEDRDQFRVWSQGMAGTADRDQSAASLHALTEYMRPLIRAKKTAPAEDVISDLIAASEEWRLSEDEIAGFAAVLLFAGHETTVARIDLGTVLLLSNPDQCDALRRDPGLASDVAEEVLRLAAPSGGFLPRYAHADIDIAGARIGAGDAVLFAIAAANRDPQAFPDPDRFDITRHASAHLAFGHGSHFCIGASLARIELEAVFGALLHRLPNLRLAIPVEGLRLHSELLTGGLAELPVTW